MQHSRVVCGDDRKRLLKNYNFHLFPGLEGRLELARAENRFIVTDSLSLAEHVWLIENGLAGNKLGRALVINAVCESHLSLLV